MWLLVEISLLSYLPLKLELGMFFINRISVGVINPYIELFELKEIPENFDIFMSKHGAPVKLAIIDNDGDLIASHNEIAWWDDGESSDEYRDVTLKDINYVLKEFNGYVNIETDVYGVIILDKKIILSFKKEKDD